MKLLKFVGLCQVAVFSSARSLNSLPFDDTLVGRQHVPKLHLSRALKKENLRLDSLPQLTSVRGGAKNKELEEKKKSKSLFPISRKELPQFTYISIMMFLFIYFYTTVRDTKDSLVVSNCGAEAIPFLKMYGVMPAAFGFIVVYSKLSQFLGKKSLFYATIFPFFAFYTLFAFVLYPNGDSIHFINGDGWLASSSIPAIKLIQYWSYSLYFIISELWASAGIPLLFWQVANDVTSISEARRFYPLFAITGNLAPIVSGTVMSNIVSKQLSSGLGFGSTLKKLAVIKIFVGCAIIVLYNLIYSRVENAKDSVENVKQEGRTKDNTNPPSTQKTTLRESIVSLSKSADIKAVAMMVLAYNICVELTEVLWKGILRETFPNKADYMKYMASFSRKVGIVALIMQLSASTIIGKLGWEKASLVAPLAMTSLALLFFTAVSFSMKRSDMVPISLALTIGTIQNIASKVTKYSLFDPLKEMAYIPMDPEAKSKGKAAIDVLGARLGRSLAAGSQQILVLASGNILHCAPFLATLYLGTASMWMGAVKALGKSFDDENLDET
eukprot:CAMPEP_0194122234 /NCGR_PEP_ID=MMETSP0150-20130528/49772_1 /TAXON_ID=122233 /ORGANISM="Chaetoceros debilis, Strain MM31A-1" /LENGTH=554 /DNA_ID=CAMNT_0038814987 /DNA_START=87 /DNA_END=1751 /DNA_ORIENTATION=+